MIEKSLNTKKNKVYYRLYGQGQPIILIHGFAEDGTIWDEQVAYLKDKFQLIVPDLPGSGRSGLIKDMSIEGLAECIHQILLKELNDPSPVGGGQKGAGSDIIMIGHSMGGYITLAFAEKYKVLLRSFGLFHSTAYADNEEKKAIRRKSIEFIQQHGSAPFIGQSIPNLFSENFRKNHPGVVQGLVEKYTNFSANSLVNYYEAMIQRPDRTHILRTFQNPVLFIMGEYDNAVPLQHSLQQAHMPEMSYIHILRQSGHMGMLEESDSCNRFLEKFLRESEIANL